MGRRRNREFESVFSDIFQKKPGCLWALVAVIGVAIVGVVVTVNGWSDSLKEEKAARAAAEDRAVSEASAWRRNAQVKLVGVTTLGEAIERLGPPDRCGLTGRSALKYYASWSTQDQRASVGVTVVSCTPDAQVTEVYNGL